jgi:hypothetical protein
VSLQCTGATSLQRDVKAVHALTSYVRTTSRTDRTGSTDQSDGTTGTDGKDGTDGTDETGGKDVTILVCSHFISLPPH